MRALHPRPRGFTLIELVVTLTLVSVLAMVAVPLYEVTVTHAKESELREGLRLIRNALDAYKAAADSGIISKGLADSGFPPNLKTLVEGVDTVAAPVTGSSFGTSSFTSNSGAAGTNGGGVNAPSGSGSPFSGSSGNSANPAPNASINSIPAHMVFLRQVPRDPFFLDQSVAPEQQWNLRAYGAMPGDFSDGADVYDVSSKSTLTGLNGIAYKDW
jgi:general secretion pathway protein G